MVVKNQTNKNAKHLPLRPLGDIPRRLLVCADSVSATQKLHTRRVRILRYGERRSCSWQFIIDTLAQWAPTHLEYCIRLLKFRITVDGVSKMASILGYLPCSAKPSASNCYLNCSAYARNFVGKVGRTQLFDVRVRFLIFYNIIIRIIYVFYGWISYRILGCKYWQYY